MKVHRSRWSIFYKQLLVGQNPVKQNESASEEQIPAENSEELGDFQMNPNMLEYGSRIAEITDFRVIDDKGMCSNTIEKGSEFKIRMKVRFNEDIQEPIMAYTIQNIQVQKSQARIPCMRMLKLSVPVRVIHVR